MGLFEVKVYVNNPTTTRALQEEIKRRINEIQPQLCLRKGHEKFRRKGAHVPAKPWRPFARCIIP